jgi:hypothetical protein
MSTARPFRSREQLFARRMSFQRVLAEENAVTERRFFDRAAMKYVRGAKRRDEPKPTIDILLLSGGGDKGAFGAGVLHGWGEVAGEAKRPQFDMVTGVSTGSMLAPFAFAGTDDAYDRILEMYSSPRPDWARKRGLVAFLKREDALVDNGGLRRFIREQLDDTLVNQIASGAREGRSLLIGTTNIDMGFMRIWDLARIAETAERTKDPTRMARILWASIAIPGIFSPIEIDGDLYVDGGASMHVFLPGARRVAQGASNPIQDLRELGLGVPKIRVWAIINNTLSPEPEVTPYRWTSVAFRSLSTAIKTGDVLALRDLQTFLELSSRSQNIDVDFHFIAIPDSFREWPGAKMFDPGVMRELSDLGREIGADPVNWHCTVPAPESAETYALTPCFKAERTRHLKAEPPVVETRDLQPASGGPAGHLDSTIS